MRRMRRRALPLPLAQAGHAACGRTIHKRRAELGVTVPLKFFFRLSLVGWCCFVQREPSVNQAYVVHHGRLNRPLYRNVGPGLCARLMRSESRSLSALCFTDSEVVFPSRDAHAGNPKWRAQGAARGPESRAGIGPWEPPVPLRRGKSPGGWLWRRPVRGPTPVTQCQRR